MMSSHLALPWRGHLDEVFHIFAYLKKKHNSEMVYDPTEVDIDWAEFPHEDWSYSFYGDDNLEEVLPINMSIPLGKSFACRVYVDSDHAGDQATRRSGTGFVVFFWTQHRFIGARRSSLAVRLVHMEVNCLQWSRPPSLFKGYVTSFEWWAFQLMNLLLFLVTINLFLPIPQTQDLPSRRIAIVLRTISCARAAWGMSGVLPTSRQRKYCRFTN